MFDCSGYTCEELAELLATARKAYNDLVLGGAIRVVVDQNGERVEFTAANQARLNMYIQSLLSEMRTLGCACVSPASKPTRALKFIF